MWPLASMPTKDGLQGIKTIYVEGQKFKIRRLNPLLDFDFNKIPQIFSASFGFKSPTIEQTSEAAIRHIHEDMLSVVAAGVVEPKLVSIGKGEDKGAESGITIQDLFRIPEIGHSLYLAILEHSLIRLRGLKRLFFYLAKLRLSYILWQLGTGAALRILRLRRGLPV